MDKKRYGLLIAAIALVFSGVGWAAGHVGNVSIRRVKPTDTVVTLSLGLPLVPGVASVVHYLPAPGHGELVQLFLRTASADRLVGESSMAARQATIHIPCTTTETTGSIFMRDLASQEIIATLPVTLLPAGPDCVR